MDNPNPNIQYLLSISRYLKLDIHDINMIHVTTEMTLSIHEFKSEKKITIVCS